MTQLTAMDLVHHTIPAEEAWARQDSIDKIIALREQLALEHLALDFGGPKGRDHLLKTYGRDKILLRVRAQRDALLAKGELYRFNPDTKKEEQVGHLDLQKLLDGLASPELLRVEVEHFSEGRATTDAWNTLALAQSEAPSPAARLVGEMLRVGKLQDDSLVDDVGTQVVGRGGRGVR